MLSPSFPTWTDRKKRIPARTYTPFKTGFGIRICVPGSFRCCCIPDEICDQAIPRKRDSMNEEPKLVLAVLRKLEGKKIRPRLNFWICTNEEVRDTLRKRT